MLTFNECYKKLLKKYPDRVASKYIEYNGNYIFLLVPKDDPEARVMDSMLAVNEKTGAIASYQPTNDENRDEFFKLWSKDDSKNKKAILFKKRG